MRQGRPQVYSGYTSIQACWNMSHPGCVVLATAPYSGIPTHSPVERRRRHHRVHRSQAGILLCPQVGSTDQSQEWRLRPLPAPPSRPWTQRGDKTAAAATLKNYSFLFVSVLIISFLIFVINLISIILGLLLLLLLFIV